MAMYSTGIQAALESPWLARFENFRELLHGKTLPETSPRQNSKGKLSLIRQLDSPARLDTIKKGELTLA